MKTGEKIRKFRLEKGLSQEELGRLVGVQKAAINKYETGVVVNIKKDMYTALANALGVSIFELMDDIPTIQVGTVKPMVKMPDLSAVDGRIFEILSDMNDEGKSRILEYAEMLDFTNLYKKCDNVQEEA